MGNCDFSLPALPTNNKTPGRACYSTRCFVVCPNSVPIKNRVFGLYFNGGPEGIRTLDLSDANRTLSQLSYKPITYHIIIHIPRQNARGFPHLFSRAFRSANVPYYFFVFHLCRFCGILRCPAEVRRSLTRQATDTIHIAK